MKSTVSSEPFTVDRSVIFRSLLACPSTGWPLWLAASVSVAVVAAGAFCGVRVLLLGLLLLFTVVPLASFFFFMIRVSAPSLLPNLMPHTVSSDDDGYQIVVFRKETEEDAEGNESVSWHKFGIFTMEREKVTKTIHTTDCDILFFRDSPLSILYIPR